MAPPLQISAHIPLERMATAFLAGLLHLAHTSSEPQPYLEAAAAALGGQAAEGAEAAARRWEMCGLSTERITGWMSQVGGGLGQGCGRCEYVSE